MADGGSITLRLSLAGEAEVKAALAGLGTEGARALKQIEQAQAQPTAGMKALNASGEEVRGGLRELAGEAGAAGNILTAMGPAGLAAAAGIGAAVAAAHELIEATKGAMEFGEQITASAKAAGVSTTALQTYRYAVEQAGGSTEQADQALRGFATAYGLAGEGQKRYLQFFEKLGFTPEQLKSFGSVEEALDATVDKISSLGNAADRAAFAKRLGLEPMLPLLQLNRDRIAELRDEAAKLGVVMDQQTVKSLTEAQEKFKSAADVINVQFKSALVNLAPDLVAIINLVANLARQLNYFMSQFQAVGDQADDALHKRIGELSDDQAQMIKAHGAGFFIGPDGKPAAGNHGGMQGNSVFASFWEKQDKITAMTAELAKRYSAAPDAAMPPPLGGFQATGPKGPKGPTLAEIQDRANALGQQGAGDLEKARKNELTAQLALTTDVNQRAVIEAAIAEMSRQESEAERDRKIATAKEQLDKLLAAKTTTEAERRIAQAAYDSFVAEENAAKIVDQRTEVLKEDLAERQRQVAVLKQSGQAEQDAYTSKLDGLKAQLALTTETQRRRDLTLQIFDIEEAMKEAELKNLADQQAQANQFTDALHTLTQLNDLRSTAGARRDAQGRSVPANDWDAQLQRMKGEIQPLNTEFKNIAADGLAQFNQSLFDADGKLQNMGQIAHSVFAKMLVDLEQYLLKQAEVGLFGGGSGGGGGGFLSTILGGLGGLFGGGAGAASSALSTDALSGGFTGLALAGGGRITGPGTGTSDSVLLWGSAGETMMTAAATNRWGPVLDWMNAHDTAPIPHFAGGGRVGGGSSGGPGGGFGATYVDNRRIELNAPGADPAQLMRLSNTFDDWRRDEPNRWAAYYITARKAGK